MKPKIPYQVFLKHKNLIAKIYQIEHYTNHSAWLKWSDIRQTWHVMGRVHDLSGTDYYNIEDIYIADVPEIVKYGILHLWFASEATFKIQFCSH